MYLYNMYIHAHAHTIHDRNIRAYNECTCEYYLYDCSAHWPLQTTIPSVSWALNLINIPTRNFYYY